jgi:hypothetical protein
LRGSNCASATSAAVPYALTGGSEEATGGRPVVPSTRPAR